MNATILLAALIVGDVQGPPIRDQQAPPIRDGIAEQPRGVWTFTPTVPGQLNYAVGGQQVGALRVADGVYMELRNGEYVAADLPDVTPPLDLLERASQRKAVTAPVAVPFAPSPPQHGSNPTVQKPVATILRTTAPAAAGRNSSSSRGAATGTRTVAPRVMFPGGTTTNSGCST